MTKTNSKRSDPAAATPSFEESLTELEGLVDKLEKDELTLEESLALFARGVTLTRTCQQALSAAEQRVRILTEQSADAQLEPFANDD
jgi:exodeoxyribonuclease VII small subunit